MKGLKKCSILTILLLLFCFVIQLGFAQGQSSDNGTQRGSNSDGLSWVEKGSIRFEWQVRGDKLECKVEAPTTGWVAVGFDPDSMMKGANILIGYVKGGTAEMEDHFGTGLTSHTRDTELGGSRDIVTRGGVEQEGITTLEFTIPLNSGDSKDKTLVEGNEYTIILAYGRDNADNLGSVHRKRASLTITL